MIYEMNHIWNAEMKWNEGNPGHEEVKISSIWLRKKKWQVLFLAVRVSPKTVVLLIKIKTEKSVSSVN